MKKLNADRVGSMVDVGLPVSFWAIWNWRTTSAVAV